MTFNKFKLLCISYLKPFEGKPFNELMHSASVNWSFDFSLSNITFANYEFKFVCTESISTMHIINKDLNNNFLLWDCRKSSFAPIEIGDLVDII